MDYAPLLAHAGFLVRKAHPAAAWMGRMSVQAGARGVSIGPTGVGTPAYEAGLDRNDQITSFDGKPVTEPSDVVAVLASHHPGDSIVVAFVQRGRERTGTVRLIEDPQLTLVPFEAAGMTVTDEMRAFRASWLGSKGGN
jgi:S1-C subfamily serine protease